MHCSVHACPVALLNGHVQPVGSPRPPHWRPYSASSRCARRVCCFFLCMVLAMQELQGDIIGVANFFNNRLRHAMNRCAEVTNRCLQLVSPGRLNGARMDVARAGTAVKTVVSCSEQGICDIKLTRSETRKPTHCPDRDGPRKLAPAQGSRP